MPNETDANYFNDLLKNNKGAKKQVAVYLDDVKLERIDMITKVFSSLSDSKGFARNTLIEEAVNKYIVESEMYLKDEYDIDIDTMIDEARFKDYDTVILSSNDDELGFNGTFLGEREPMCWYPCSISDNREKNLKYIAIYRGDPKSSITHYAVIKDIKYSPEKGCKVCYFKGKPKELPNGEITLGSRPGVFFRGAKYTKFENLSNSTTADEISFV
jgi:hypothetical protein